eukprot:2579721-Prymnesium_polylepis.2
MVLPAGSMFATLVVGALRGDAIMKEVADPRKMHSWRGPPEAKPVIGAYVGGHQMMNIAFAALSQEVVWGISSVAALRTSLSGQRCAGSKIDRCSHIAEQQKRRAHVIGRRSCSRCSQEQHGRPHHPHPPKGHKNHRDTMRTHGISPRIRGEIP